MKTLFAILLLVIMGILGLWITTMMKHKIYNNLKDPETLKLAKEIIDKIYFDNLDLNQIKKFEILEFWDGKIYQFIIETKHSLKKQFIESERIEKDSELSSNDIKMFQGILGENIEEESSVPWFRQKLIESIKAKNFIIYKYETHYVLYDVDKNLFFIYGISP